MGLYLRCEVCRAMSDGAEDYRALHRQGWRIIYRRMDGHHVYCPEHRQQTGRPAGRRRQPWRTAKGEDEGCEAVVSEAGSRRRATS